MDLKYYLPLLLVIISNVFYHNIAKNSPGNANVYLSLAVSYTIRQLLGVGLCVLGLFLIKVH